MVPMPRWFNGTRNAACPDVVAVDANPMTIVERIGGNALRAKLVATDQNGVATIITVDRTAPLQTFMDAFSGLKGVPTSRVCFMVDGDTLLPTDTMEALGLLDHEDIEAIDTEGLQTSTGWVIWA